MSKLSTSMKARSLTFNSFDDLLKAELYDLYDCEDRIINALPKVAKAVTSPQLKAGITEHLKQTKQQKVRLEQVFRRLGYDARSHTCPAMKGLLEEGATVIKAKGDPRVKDAAILANAQRIEQYEIAAYGSARTFAEELGYSDVASILQQTLDEEGETDKKLTSLAVQEVNAQAKMAGARSM
jgi:ferritin-like metal-binding protein YciE